MLLIGRTIRFSLKTCGVAIIAIIISRRMSIFQLEMPYY